MDVSIQILKVCGSYSICMTTEAEDELNDGGTKRCVSTKKQLNSLTLDRAIDEARQFLNRIEGKPA